jgi:hypothetical protein
MTPNKRTAGIVALGLAFTVWAGAAITHEIDVRTSVPASITCQEDDPCWDCHSLGNRICGPQNEAEREAGWAVWEYGNGAHSLKVDTSRAFRVDYVGNSIDYPRALRENDLALPGKDGNWYVFRAEYTTAK